jgi:23S rRNA 5-hydroxycytidine C2501 synthase
MTGKNISAALALEIPSFAPDASKLAPAGSLGIIKSIKLELLAPAKNLETGKVAILAGADAVYIGGPDFGARSAASNQWEDIKKLITFAHQYYAKVYVVLNTIFFDNEAKQVKEFINKAYEIGADALIVQDMGILEMDLPPIPLFASTQCDNYGVEQIKFLAEAGLSRVILARELNLDQIKEIRSQAKVDLEAFVHGALCVSYSGRCYFSQALCGKSANRGKCAQICRQPFDLVDAEGKVLAKDKYLLSLKDLNLSASLAELVEAGITSFKIEGRLKDAAYAGNVTAKYRQELDKIIAASGGKYARASSGKNEFNFTPDPNKTFNRGYTEYFLRGRKGEILSPNTQKSMGEFIGTVESAECSHFSLDTRHDLKNGDGICWFDREGELAGTNVNMVKDGKIYPNKVLPLSVGAQIYRNENPAFEKAVLGGSSRRVGVDFIVKENKKGFAIEVFDEDGNSVELKFLAEKNPAEKIEMALRNWREQLSKLGETIFYALDVKFAWDKPYFVPMSVLNEWRRKLAVALLKERVKKYPRLTVEHKKTVHPYPVKKLDYNFNVSNKLAADFYARHGAEVAEEAMEKTNYTQGKILMTARHCLKHWLGVCPRKGKRAPNFKEPLYLVQNGHKYRLNFDCGHCQMEVVSG